MSKNNPERFRVDHISWSVPNLDDAARFYREAFGAEELYRIGPIDARDLPPSHDGRDWMATHVNVEDAKLTLVMMKLDANLNFQLVQYDRPDSATEKPPRNCDRGGHHLAFAVDDADKTSQYLATLGCQVFDEILVEAGPGAGRFRYVLDPWGHQIEICEYLTVEEKE
jgi:catechol 2,3-dioxygenase-like lactoylglutathione lyase family enzyme